MEKYIEELAQIIQDTRLPIMSGEAIIGETHVYPGEALRIAENLYSKGYCKGSQNEQKPEVDIELYDLPAEDVIELKHGEWLMCYNEHHHLTSCKCSICQKAAFEHAKYIGYKYCPFCGAKMDAKEILIK